MYNITREDVRFTDLICSRIHSLVSQLHIMERLALDEYLINFGI